MDFIDGRDCLEVELSDWRGILAPSVSPANHGRIYFDSTDDTFKASVNGGAYFDILSSATGLLLDQFSPQLTHGSPNFDGYSVRMPPPTVSVAISATPGTLAAGTYYYTVLSYRVVSGLPYVSYRSNEDAVTVDGTQGVDITISFVPSADVYIICRTQVSGSYTGYINFVVQDATSTSYSYTDTGDANNAVAVIEGEATDGHIDQYGMTSMLPINMRNGGAFLFGDNLTSLGIKGISYGGVIYPTIYATDGGVAAKLGIEDQVVMFGHSVSMPGFVFINQDTGLSASFGLEEDGGEAGFGGMGYMRAGRLGAGDGILDVFRASRGFLSPSAVGDGSRIRMTAMRDAAFFASAFDMGYIDFVPEDTGETTYAAHMDFYTCPTGASPALAMRLNSDQSTMVAEIFQVRSGTITRDGSGYISTVARTGGKTYTITRNGSNQVSSFTDGTLTWTLTRNGSGYITSWGVA